MDLSLRSRAQVRIDIDSMRMIERAAGPANTRVSVLGMIDALTPTAGCSASRSKSCRPNGIDAQSSTRSSIRRSRIERSVGQSRPTGDSLCATLVSYIPPSVCPSGDWAR